MMGQRALSGGRSVKLAGGTRGSIRDVMCVRVPEYPARSRGRWIISRLSRPWAGTEPSIFLFPQRPLRLEPPPSFFFLSSEPRGSQKREGGSMALSDIPRVRNERRFSRRFSRFLSRILALARAEHILSDEKCTLESADRLMKPAATGIDPYSLMDETFGFFLVVKIFAILKRESFIYGDIARSLHEVEHNAIFRFWKNSFLEQTPTLVFIRCISDIFRQKS